VVVGTLFAESPGDADFTMEDVMTSKKSTRAKSPATAKKTTRITAGTKPEPATRATHGSPARMGAGAILVVICVMAAAMLLSARETPTPAAAHDERVGAVVTATGAVKDASTSASDARPSMMTSVAEASKSPSAKSSPVTITGCLERHDAAFRLTETDGGDAPKSRSWKSGFLRKGTASVDVVDPARNLRLASHVGHRVSVTGVLENREMRVRSVRQIAPACN
jgi:hypothetical protein